MSGRWIRDCGGILDQVKKHENIKGSSAPFKELLNIFMLFRKLKLGSSDKLCQ